jgi:hypothetical protein
MIIGIHGTKSFDDYNIFLRAMGTALSMLNESDKEIILYTAGPARVNSMALEFSNVSERSLKARGIRIRTNKVPPKWLKENILAVDYLTFFSKPKEPLSDIVEAAEAKDVEVGVYRY